MTSSSIHDSSTAFIWPNGLPQISEHHFSNIPDRLYSEPPIIEPCPEIFAIRQLLNSSGGLVDKWTETAWLVQKHEHDPVSSSKPDISLSSVIPMKYLSFLRIVGSPFIAISSLRPVPESVSYLSRPPGGSDRMITFRHRFTRMRGLFRTGDCKFVWHSAKDGFRNGTAHPRLGMDQLLFCHVILRSIQLVLEGMKILFWHICFGIQPSLSHRLRLSVAHDTLPQEEDREFKLLN
jgi:hypothetical protein